MEDNAIKIIDVLSSEYSDFLDYCASSGKVFTYEIKNVDFVAFRASSGRTRDYIKIIRSIIENPDVARQEQISESRTLALSSNDCALENSYSNSCLDENGKSGADQDYAQSSVEVPVENDSGVIVSFSGTEADGIVDQIIISDNNNSNQTDRVEDRHSTDSLAEVFRANANDYVEKSIDELSLSKRTATCLYKADVKTIADILNISKYDLYQIPNMGKNSVSEVLFRLRVFLPDRNHSSLAYYLGVTASDFEKSSIASLNLSVRATNCLDHANIQTVADILNLSEEVLLQIRNMGRKSVSEVISKVKAFILDCEREEKLSKERIILPSTSSPASCEIDDSFKNLVEALIMDDSYDTGALSEDQLDLFNNIEEQDKELNLLREVSTLKNKYGKNILLRTISLEKGSNQRERNRLVGGHNAE